MTTDREVMQQALDALLDSQRYDCNWERHVQAIRNLEARLAKPEQPCPPGYKCVPVEATDEQIKLAIQCALNANLGSAYSWSEYMRDLYKIMLQAAPEPANTCYNRLEE